MPAINRPINLHWQDNPVSPGFYLYQDKILSRNTLCYFAAVVDVLRVNGGTFYRITPLTLNPFKAGTWYDHLHLFPELLERRLPLRNIVAVWASQSGQSFADCWRQLKAAFKLSSIKDLPSSWVVDAIDWVQEKIDNASAASALPAASSAQALPPATDLPALPADTPKKAQYIECALREALSKLEYAYQLQNFYGTPDKACKGNEEHLKFLHVSCMSNINAAAAITRALIALR